MPDTVLDADLRRIQEKYKFSDSELRRYLSEEEVQKHFLLLIERIARRYRFGLKRSLVVGAGRGGLTCNLLLRGYSVDSIEPYKPYLDIIEYKFSKYAIKGNLLNGTAENVELPAEFYDFVAMIDVIEHVEDPAIVLTKLRQALVENGAIYLTVPNRFHLRDPHYKMYFICLMPLKWSDRLLKFLGRLKEDGENGRQQLSTMHYYRFRSFVHFAESLGFKVIDIRRLQTLEPEEYLVQRGKFMRLAKIIRRARLSVLLIWFGRMFLGHRLLLIKSD